MLRQLKIQQSHEDLFIERYEALLSQALHIAEGDRQQAEDLLHDAFIQLTLLRPDLSKVTNIDGYLFITLRNLRLSQVRRAGSNRLSSLASYDSIQFALRAFDLRNQLQLQDELRAICHYATRRKQTSKAGSVLILRFFHGYYPSEVALILRSRRNVADHWLGLARREVKLYLEDPEALVFMHEGQLEGRRTPRRESSPSDFFSELRAQIFQSRRGLCLSAEEFGELYAAENPSTIDCDQFAHLVSCPDCLDRVNRLLNLPLLAQRNPFDVLGRDPQPKDGGGSGGAAGGGGTGATPSKTFAQISRHEARVTFEHR